MLIGVVSAAFLIQCISLHRPSLTFVQYFSEPIQEARHIVPWLRPQVNHRVQTLDSVSVLDNVFVVDKNGDIGTESAHVFKLVAWIEPACRTKPSSFLWEYFHCRWAQWWQKDKVCYVFTVYAPTDVGALFLVLVLSQSQHQANNSSLFFSRLLRYLIIKLIRNIVY